MFEIGWSELLVIGVVALIAIGPRELPGVLRTVGLWLGKVRRMAAEFQGHFQEALREAELTDLKKEVDAIRDTAHNFASGITDATRINDPTPPPAPTDPIPGGPPPPLAAGPQPNGVPPQAPAEPHALGASADEPLLPFPDQPQPLPAPAEQAVLPFPAEHQAVVAKEPAVPAPVAPAALPAAAEPHATPALQAAPAPPADFGLPPPEPPAPVTNKDFAAAVTVLPPKAGESGG